MRGGERREKRREEGREEGRNKNIGNDCQWVKNIFKYQLLVCWNILNTESWMRAFIKMALLVIPSWLQNLWQSHIWCIGRCLMQDHRASLADSLIQWFWSLCLLELFYKIARMSLSTCFSLWWTKDPRGYKPIIEINIHYI